MINLPLFGRRERGREDSLPWLALPARPQPAQTARRMFGADDRLVFVHMEKTAGSSVHESLATLFPEDQVCPDRFSSIKERDASYLAPFRLFTAHATLSDFARVPDRPFFITFLRDPIERKVSAYRFWSIMASNGFISRAVARSFFSAPTSSSRPRAIG